MPSVRGNETWPTSGGRTSTIFGEAVSWSVQTQPNMSGDHGAILCQLVPCPPPFTDSFRLKIGQTLTQTCVNGHVK